MNNTKKSGNNLPSVNMISEGSHLKGTLETKSDIRIAGTLDGEAKAKGKVIVSSSGKVEGDIEATDADVAGNVDGEIRVTNKLMLRKSAFVEGDVYTKTLLVEEGAKINGAFKMGEEVQTDIKKNGVTGLPDTKGKEKKQADKAKQKESEG